MCTECIRVQINPRLTYSQPAASSFLPSLSGYSAYRSVPMAWLSVVRRCPACELRLQCLAFVCLGSEEAAALTAKAVPTLTVGQRSHRLVTVGGGRGGGGGGGGGARRGQWSGVWRGGRGEGLAMCGRLLQRRVGVGVHLLHHDAARAKQRIHSTEAYRAHHTAATAERRKEVSQGRRWLSCAWPAPLLLPFHLVRAGRADPVQLPIPPA